MGDLSVCQVEHGALRGGALWPWAGVASALENGRWAVKQRARVGMTGPRTRSGMTGAEDQLRYDPKCSQRAWSKIPCGATCGPHAIRCSHGRAFR